MRGFQISFSKPQKVRLERALEQLESISSKANSDAIVTVADTIPVNYEDGVLKGHGTTDMDGRLVATTCGVVERVNKLVYVRALRARGKDHHSAPSMSPSPVSSGSRAAGGISNPKKSLGFLENAAKRKHSFIQFFAMTGILLLSLRSVGQKYRIYELQEDNAALEEEKEGLDKRLDNIKQSLFDEAAS